MDLSNLCDLKTGKDLKRPAARLTGPVRPVLSRPIISLEKNGVSDAWRIDLIFTQKPNRTLLRKNTLFSGWRISLIRKLFFTKGVQI
jgi:hypothetical protein